MMRTFLFLPAVLLMATNAMAASPMGPMPTVEEANAAFARNPDYTIDGKLEKIEACVPGGWEDTSEAQKDETWWCLGNVKPASGDAALTEFVMIKEKGRFEVELGEWMGMCPAPADAEKAIKPMVTMQGVTGLYTGAVPAGQFVTDVPADDPLAKELAGSPYLFLCEYLGMLGKANYLIQTFVTYDAQGYHFTDHAFEQLFNDDGQLIDKDGKVLPDQG